MNRKSLFVRVSLAIAAGGVFLTLALAAPSQTSSTTAAKEVYVCACMKTASCPCAAMSNKAGKCPCGHDDMKAVAKNGKWAATNRKELSE
jgi:hypothetical protein